MSVILTNGQSFDQIAAQFTLAPEYGVAIANHNNMEGQSITGKRFRIEIPDTWMKPEYAGKEITLPGTGIAKPSVTDQTIIPGLPNWALYAIGAGALFLLVTK